MPRKKPLVRKSKGKNPLRMDPTRTASLRRAFEKQLSARFARLRLKFWTLLVDEDALGLLPQNQHPLGLHPFVRVVGRNFWDGIANCGGAGGTPGPCPSIKQALGAFDTVVRENLKGVKGKTLHPTVAEGNIELAKGDFKTTVGSKVETALLRVRKSLKDSGKGHEFGAIKAEVMSSLQEFETAVKTRGQDAQGSSSKEDRYWNRKEVMSRLKKVGENLAWARRRAGLTTNERLHWLDQLTLNCGGVGSGVPGPCPSGVSPQEAAEAKPFSSKLKALGAKAGQIEHAIKEGVAKAISKLPTPVQTVLAATYHTAFAGWTASQALAERVAVERGSTPEQAAKLKGVLATVDIAAFKPLSIALTASGVGAAAQSITWVIPPATGAYLAYSLIRNPIKTIKAATGLVKDSIKSLASKVLGRKVGNVEEDLANLMADALEAHDYDDWYVAILTQALAENLSPKEALALADDVYAQTPVSLAEGDDLDSDAEELFATPGKVVNAGRWQFATSPTKVKEFKVWLKTQIQGEITGRSERELWEAYTRLGLQKGAGRAFDDTKRPQRIIDEGRERLDFYQGSRDEFLRSSFHKPVAIEKVELLAERSFDELENVTRDMATRMTRSLTDGLVRGASPREIARDLDDDLDIGRNRALTIARTEIVRAHAEGQLMALEQLGVEEVGVAVEWSTAGDDKVCELCAPLEGVILKLDEAKGMLPRHPSCRCAWIPANVGEDSEGQKDTQASIGRALELSIDGEGGFESSRWMGADLTPATSRPQSQVGNEDYLIQFSKAMDDVILNCGGPGSGVPGPCAKDKKASPTKSKSKAKSKAKKPAAKPAKKSTPSITKEKVKSPQSKPLARTPPATKIPPVTILPQAPSVTPSPSSGFAVAATPSTRQETINSIHNGLNEISPGARETLSKAGVKFKATGNLAEAEGGTAAARGHYNPTTKEVAVGGNAQERTVKHEVGHAIDMALGNQTIAGFSGRGQVSTAGSDWRRLEGGSHKEGSYASALVKDISSMSPADKARFSYFITGAASGIAGGVGRAMEESFAENFYHLNRSPRDSVTDKQNKDSDRQEAHARAFPNSLAWMQQNLAPLGVLR